MFQEHDFMHLKDVCVYWDAKRLLPSIPSFLA